MQDYYRYRFLRPGLAPDKGLARVLGWVLGAGILIAIWSVGMHGEGIRGPGSGPEQAGALVFVFGFALTVPALLLGAIWPCPARRLAAAALAIGLLASSIQGLLVSSPHVGGSVIALVVVIYFAVALFVLRHHWQPMTHSAARIDPPCGNPVSPELLDPADQLRDRSAIRRILGRWRRRGRRASRAMPD